MILTRGKTTHGASDVNVSLILNPEEFNILTHAVLLLHLSSIDAEENEVKKEKILKMLKTLQTI